VLIIQTETCNRHSGRTVALRQGGAARGRQAAEVLAVDGVAKTYGSGSAAVRALEPISFEVRRGEFVAVIGPSGCGKSTLFNIVGGLLEDYEGTVRLDGVPIAGPHPQIAMVFQEESIFPWRTLLQNVAFPLEVRGVARAERDERARRTIELVGLAGFEHRHPAALSGGMRQRTALARALCAEPEILLMDEPFAAVDEQTRLLLGEKLLEIWQRLRQTTLLITHSIAEAVQLADRVVVMSFRPGTIKQIVEIDLPRPRTGEVLAGERFAHLVALIWNDLRAEAARGMLTLENKERLS
jgi:NitT/TauT family transport system ATP-binding protein